MHCFTETWDVARAALDLGFHISFSGIVTFKNAHDAEGRRAPRAARPHADRDRLAVSRAGAVSRQAQPAGVRSARRRRRSRGCAAFRSRRSRATTSANFFRLFRIDPQRGAACRIDPSRDCRRSSPRCCAIAARSLRSRRRRSAAGARRLRHRRRQRSRRRGDAPARARRRSEQRRRQRRSGADRRRARGLRRDASTCCSRRAPTSTRATASATRALMIAALTGHLDVVKKLRARGAEVNQTGLDAADLRGDRRPRRHRPLSAGRGRATSTRRRRTGRRR